MTGQRFAFGQFVLDPDTGSVSRKGVPLPAGYRAVRLLAELTKRAPDIVTKAELMDAGWPGMAVEEGNLTVQIATLRKLLGDAPDGEWIATIPRVGYRFGQAVQRVAEARGNADREEARQTEAGLSIAVLPFINLSGDAEQEYFADGLTEDITTALARLRGLFVTARNSSFTYKGRVVDVKQVGRELGVRYVLQGSVRRSGQHVRVGAELADTSSGAQVWAARYDAELSDFLALQDQITENVVATIEPQLYAAENLRKPRRLGIRDAGDAARLGVGLPRRYRHGGRPP